MKQAIPLNAEVMCIDGLAGETISVIVNPDTKRVTHVVVQDKSFPKQMEWMVPLEKVTSSTPKKITLNCTRDELNNMQPFTRKYYLEQEIPGYGYAYSLPYMKAPTDMLHPQVEELNVPHEDLALNRGIDVEALDGHIGQIGELLIDQHNGEITHFTLLRGHLWGKKEVVIPLSFVERVDQDTVYLKFDKKHIDDLPSLPLNRPWDEVKATDLDLMVWSFSGLAQAEEAYKLLKDLQKDRQIDLMNVVVITKDVDGKVSLQESKEVDLRRGTLRGAITGGLVGLLIGPGGAIIGAVGGAAAGRRSAKRVEVGVSNDRLKALQDDMPPSSSAIVLLVEHRWFETVRQSIAGVDHKFFHTRLANVGMDRPVEPGEEDLAV